MEREVRKLTGYSERKSDDRDAANNLRIDLVQTDGRIGIRGDIKDTNFIIFSKRTYNSIFLL